ncbi:type II toxin-antitoxin system HipA family toxin YjjJ [Aromatoleum toluolicum]|uniref:Type II toxin-antitoxin system HipA family toxin YjjJ n=1 Tax=Aromatoleum toluolicum TaxID=90060 RepID=A0ABX1NCL8_9RHOO|nr:type II toxin-antitoxin system HipA family toxin YjjJ [Aromatoleum toluolicum]NMF97004.1 type II toxin-antitoxin system HipA family toxin YjjJ [Aromatoleum toluolicum]
MKVTVNDLRQALMKHPRASGAELCRLLKGVNRSTVMRLMAQIEGEVIRRGGSRRTRYALRRALRGRNDSLPLYRVDATGTGHVVGALDLTYPEGSALMFGEPFAWPLDKGEMSDGWFDGLPYPLLDMRPQGFLGRNFAHLCWQSLEVTESLNDWSDDDVVHVLATRGHDQSGDLILGERAYQRHLDARRDWESRLIGADQVALVYPEQAELALAQGVAGSSAAGEFPKFTAMRVLAGDPVSVIVKFSGADASAAVRRWSDLLVCEHLALETLSAELGIRTARSAIYHHAGRTFLEVVRFDRRGAHGRLPVCALSSLNGALLGKAGASWPAMAGALHQNGWLPAETVGQVTLIWWFGRLIANTDMHDGNLSFHPGLTLAPVYDMLPMRYAPHRGGEVPPQTYEPALPLPTEALEWRRAAQAAIAYWARCAADARISADFQAICAENAIILRRAVEG